MNRRFIDVVQPPRRKVARPSTSRQSPTPAPRFAKVSAVPARKRQKAWDIMVAVLVSPILFGLAWLGMVGAVLAAACGVVALCMRLPSRAALVLAVLALIYMTGLELASAATLAQTMATMAYELLSFGLVMFAIEARHENKFWFRH